MKRGIKIVQTRWIDINKGDAANPVYRSRLVAKEFNVDKQSGLFAATPPLEALKMLVSDVATCDAGTEDKVFMVNDVARAFFEAPVTRDMCVEMPEEARAEGEGDMVALLKKSLYGTRDAAANFQSEVRKVMKSMGFRVGRYNVSTYYHRTKQLKTMVHGDDFVTSGGRREVQWLKEQLQKRFEIKTTIVGRRNVEAKEVRVLNRVVRVTEGGWEYEADQRHGELIVQTLGMEGSKPVCSPGEDLKPWEEENDKEKLQGAKATEYRGLAARANYLALDRSDIQYAVKEICRGMAAPTVGDRKKLKRLARYLVGVPRVVWKYDTQWAAGGFQGYSDSDWAGCKRTARSTSGGTIMLGQHCLKTWSATQKSITLSSGEAELVAAVKMSTELIGMCQLARDWGMELRAKVWVDSSAALGVAARRGNGKLRHVRVGMLWIQEKLEEGELEMAKVKGEENPADLMTKNLGRRIIDKHMEMMRQQQTEGRADLGLRI